MSEEEVRPPKSKVAQGRYDKMVKKWVGQKIDNLEIVAFEGFTKRGKIWVPRVILKCFCGRIFSILRSNMNKTKCCGCLWDCPGKSGTSSDWIKKKGEDHYNSRLTSRNVKTIRELYKTGFYSCSKIALMFDVSRSTIREVILNQIYVDEKYISPHTMKNHVKPGKKFFKLTCLEYCKISKKYKFECDCGNIRFYYSHTVKKGKCKSCGCYKFEWLKKKNRQNKKPFTVSNIPKQKRQKKLQEPLPPLLLQHLPDPRQLEFDLPGLHLHKEGDKN